MKLSGNGRKLLFHLAVDDLQHFGFEGVMVLFPRREDFIVLQYQQAAYVGHIGRL